MAKRGMNERIQRLREQSVTTPVHIDLERAKIETDFYKENDGKYSVPVMRAMTLKEYFSKKTLYFGDDELILGEKGKNPQASPTFPELCCHSEEDMKVMSERKLVSFHTTEEDRKLQAAEIIPFWKGRTIREKLLSRMTPEWHDCSWNSAARDTHAAASRYSLPATWITRKRLRRPWTLWIG